MPQPPAALNPGELYCPRCGRPAKQTDGNFGKVLALEVVGRAFGAQFIGLAYMMIARPYLCVICGKVPAREVENSRRNIALKEAEAKKLAEIKRNAPKICPHSHSSFALGVVSPILLGITGVPAIIYGHLALSQIKKSNGMLTGRARAITGLTLGYVVSTVALFLLLLEVSLKPAPRTPLRSKPAKTNSTANPSVPAQRPASEIKQNP
ncbi:MAG: DUF4190 domain-containing protein [Fimbriimonadaceae bacterium]